MDKQQQRATRRGRAPALLLGGVATVTAILGLGHPAASRAAEGPSPVSQTVLIDQKFLQPGDRTDPVEVAMASGVCTVGAIDVRIGVSDSYRGRASQRAQPNEQVVVDLLRGKHTVATTAASPDLSDEFDSVRADYDLGRFEDPQPGDHVMVRMADEAAGGGNSIHVDFLTLTPVCETEPSVVVEETIVEEERVKEVLVCRSKQDGALLRMYDSYFNRSPDFGGFAFWSTQLAGGMTLLRISEFFYSSPEFQSNNANLSDSEFVQYMYQNGLEREGEAAGQAYWEDRLANGLSRPAMVASMMSQAEALRLSCGAEAIDG